MKKPVLHLICNAHLDPVWQWRWEEGCAEAITTFAIAAQLLREVPGFIFNHNEATLYRWVKKYAPGLFEEIRELVAAGRWCISGGWDIQPDVNMPGTEAIIRHIAQGRRFFQAEFGVHPVVAYNFDSFGHSGGLPQILRQAGYEMYVHMRPEQRDLPLPAHLYRWKGVDGSVIAVYRIPFPAYNTFHGKAVERIAAAAEIALRDGQDTPVFWGLGDHGGGATRRELEQIKDLIEGETRVEIIHSSTERYYQAIRNEIPHAPLVEGDLQRVCTGCYTSMSRLKRRMQRNLAELTQAEALAAAAWWLRKAPYPAEGLEDAWRDHLFNDFHDILPGSSVEVAEQDALDLYGRSSETMRRLRLGTAAAFSPGQRVPLEIPLTVLNANPGASKVPVEVEYMIDHVPKFTGSWHARLFTLDGQEIPLQEEHAAQLLLTDSWRRKLCFDAELPAVGAAHYRIEMHEGPRTAARFTPASDHAIDLTTGLLSRLATSRGSDLLAGPAPKPLVVEDLADSWGMEEWRYRNVLGAFEPSGPPRVVEEGPVRRITESLLTYQGSRIALRTIAYGRSPFVEMRLRIQWNEERKRLKLSIPTRFLGSLPLVEVPGGAIRRPADGDEQIQGRWMIVAGEIDGAPAALGVIAAGMNGFDVRDGEIRLSVLRGAPYCWERTYPLERAPKISYMDQGTHETRLLLLPGEPESVEHAVVGLAEWLSAPPYALAHFPVGGDAAVQEGLFSLRPGNIRLLACKRSWDGKALIVRLQESVGKRTEATLHIEPSSNELSLVFEPYELKSIRLDTGTHSKEVMPIEER